MSITVHEYDATVDSEEECDQQARPSKPGGMCLKCAKKEIEYMAEPCEHPVFCKACAMKCATGGKCKVCHVLFSGLSRMS